MNRTVLAVSVITLALAPAYAETESTARLASQSEQLNTAPTAEGRVGVPLHHSVRTIMYTGGGIEPEHVVLAATETVPYRYDDNSFEGGIGTPGYAAQAAQRFRLIDQGTVRWLEACFMNSLFDRTSEHTFYFDILSDSNGSPGSSLTGGRELIKSGMIDFFGGPTCLRLNYSQRISDSYIWVAVLYFGDEGLRQHGLPGEGRNLAVDTGKPRETIVRARGVHGTDGEITAFGPWQSISDLSLGLFDAGALGIRMAVDHETDDPPPPDPDPEPDPDPPTDGPCLPTTDVLHFDGGYRVSMCYATHEGDTGQAKAGVWASSQSGILWFFSRENAEVLVKVLDGCRHNGHRWVFVAPVTDVGFELRITAPDGEIWTHTNQVGTTAPTRSDTSAFRCQ